MKSDLDINSVVKIETMPKIFEQLELIGSFVDEQLEGVSDMACTEENKQIVKQKRTEINNTLKVLEEKRKDIKKQILTPYEMFNDKYETTIKGKLQNASDILGTKILGIEDEQKSQKEAMLREFAQEHFIANNIQGVVAFEDIGLNITLSASEKSLKEKVLEFCERVSNDLDLIALENFKDEIYVEYKKNLNFAHSKMIVVERHKEIELAKQREEELQKKLEQEKIIVANVEEAVETIEIVAPVEVEEPKEEILEVEFKVWGSKEEIIKVRNFIKELGLKYE